MKRCISTGSAKYILSVRRKPQTGLSALQKRWKTYDGPSVSAVAAHCSQCHETHKPERLIRQILRVRRIFMAKILNDELMVVLFRVQPPKQRMPVD
jgi:hypothetical protein